MSLISSRLVRTVAVVVVWPLAATAQATELPDAAHDPGFEGSAALEKASRIVPGDGADNHQGVMPHARPAALGLAPLTRVRVETRPPSDVRGHVVQEDWRSVLLEAEPGGERFALSKVMRKLEGRLGPVDGESVTLFLGEQGAVRIRRQDIVRLQVPGKGSPFYATVGALLGLCVGAWVATGGFGAVDTLETGSDSGAETGPLLIAITGAVLGAAVLGRGGWKTVPLPHSHRLSLAVKPARSSAAVGLSVRF